MRLLKPAHGTPEVRAVHRKDLKLFAFRPPHPAGNVGCLAVPRACVRIAKFRHARLVLRETVERAKRSEEHTSELQSLRHLVCRLLLEKKKKETINNQVNDITSWCRYRRSQ